jgi:hypothetical protein
LRTGSSGVAEYRVIVSHRDPEDPLSPDRLLIRIGLDDSVDANAWREGSPREELRTRVKHATEVSPEVELVEALSEIYDPSSEFKATRVIDERRYE